tara:strand:- start:552 stop:851 length:300 start_codon:yes stop_codon:yes gene_type:complete
MYNKKMDLEDFLEQSNVEQTVIEILTQVHPVLMSSSENTDASPWEIATSLMVLLAGVGTGAQLDKTILMNLLSLLIDQTAEHPLLFSELGQMPSSTTKH